MKLSRTNMSLADDWRQSSWTRRAAALRLGYTPLIIALIPVLLSLFPALPRQIMPYFARIFLPILTLSVPHLIFFSPHPAETDTVFQGSPNARFIKGFFTVYPECRNSEHWKRPFYRVCIYALTVLMFTVGVSLGVFFAPLLLVERLLWGRAR